MFSNLTLAQKIAMGLVALSAIAGGTSQLAPILGAAAAASVAGLAALGGTILSGWMFIITGQQGLVGQVQNTQGGQAALVKSVLAMPGVEPVAVNKNASPELAALALDPNETKIAPKPSDEIAVTQVASAKQ